MNNASTPSLWDDVKELAADFGGWALEHGWNLATLFVGAFLVGVSIVMTFFGVWQAYLRPGEIDLFWDSLRIAIIVTAFFVGMKIMRESDYTERLFRRW